MKKAICMLLMAMLSVGLLVGCGKEEKEESEKSSLEKFNEALEDYGIDPDLSTREKFDNYSEEPETYFVEEEPQSELHLTAGTRTDGSVISPDNNSLDALIGDDPWQFDDELDQVLLDELYNNNFITKNPEDPACVTMHRMDMPWVTLKLYNKDRTAVTKEDILQDGFGGYRIEYYPNAARQSVDDIIAGKPDIYIKSNAPSKLGVNLNWGTMATIDGKNVTEHKITEEISFYGKSGFSETMKELSSGGFVPSDHYAEDYANEVVEIGYRFILQDGTQIGICTDMEGISMVDVQLAK